MKLGSPEALRREPSLEPPDTHNCEEEGHRFRYVYSKGGLSLYRCEVCRQESVEED